MKNPWIGVQYWENPIFMHWPVPYNALRPLVPEPFQLDTFNGDAWVGIVPFKAVQTYPRWGKGLFSLGPFWQLNIRTYIRFFEEPAVYFLTVYTNSKLSVLGAGSLLSLPYQYARFHASRNENHISCNMKQISPRQNASFSMAVHPSTEGYYPSENTLEHWLTERYHFYALKGKYIVKASVTHPPWFLHDADYDMTHHHLCSLIPETKRPLIHVAASKKTYLHPFKIKGQYFR